MTTETTTDPVPAIRAALANAETALADLYRQRAHLDPSSNSAGENEDYYRALATESARKSAEYAAESTSGDLRGEDGDKPADTAVTA